MERIIESLDLKQIRQRIDVYVAEKGRENASKRINESRHLLGQLIIAHYLVAADELPLEQDYPDFPGILTWRTYYSNMDIEQEVALFIRHVLFFQQRMNTDSRWPQKKVYLHVVRLLAVETGQLEFYDQMFGQPILAPDSALGYHVTQAQMHLDGKDGLQP